jgi:hypothetical protein
MSTTKKKLPATYVGLSISPTVVEAVVLQPSKDPAAQPHRVVSSFTYPIPQGIFNPSGDELIDPAGLTSVLGNVMNQAKAKTRMVHLSLPATLLRVTEMPRVQPKELYLSLSSEAERYKIFDNSDAVVDFEIIDSPGLPANQCRVVFGAIRSDTLNGLKTAFQKARIKIASIDLEPMNVLRGMAGSAVLDSLVQQIGPNAFWGTIFVESERIRLALWQGNNLIELREVQMDTRDFALADPGSLAANDLFDEISRTAKTNLPSIWLTYKMPLEMDSLLSQRLNVPVRPCLIGPAVTLDQTNLQVATVGASLRSLVTFPFDFDLISSSKAFAVPAKVANKPDNSAQTEALAAFLTVGGGALLVLSLIIWGILALVDMFYFQAQLLAKAGEVSQLTAQITELDNKILTIKGVSDYQNFAKEAMRQTKIRNSAFVSFMNDLRDKSPGQLWVYQVKVDDKLAVLGRALEHQSVLNLAKSFDDVPYAKKILIKSIKEAMVGGQPVFNFQFDGELNLKPDLLQPVETPVAPAPGDPAAVAEPDDLTIPSAPAEGGQ